MTMGPTMTIGDPNYPWNQGALRSWQICGMNHYQVDGERRLFVSMTRQNLCIKAEGADEHQLFLELDSHAAVLNQIVDASNG